MYIGVGCNAEELHNVSALVCNRTYSDRCGLEDTDLALSSPMIEISWCYIFVLELCET